jgi:hypothetical protein
VVASLAKVISFATSASFLEGILFFFGLAPRETFACAGDVLFAALFAIKVLPRRKDNPPAATPNGQDHRHTKEQWHDALKVQHTQDHDQDQHKVQQRKKSYRARHRKKNWAPEVLDGSTAGGMLFWRPNTTLSNFVSHEGITWTEDW